VSCACASLSDEGKIRQKVLPSKFTTISNIENAFSRECLEVFIETYHKFSPELLNFGGRHVGVESPAPLRRRRRSPPSPQLFQLHR